MATINVAFSSGLESVAMVVKGLRDGHKLNLCVINVSNNRQTFLFEVWNTLRFMKYCEANMKELGFKGCFGTFYISPRCPWGPIRGGGTKEDVVVNTITQQFGTLLGMLDLRRLNVMTEYPGVWIGWLKQDAAEYSFNEYDHTEQDYKDLLELPKKLGRLAVADRTGTVYRAPLWELTKGQVLAMIPEQLIPFVIHTGQASIHRSEDKIVYNVYSHKRDEWRGANIDAEMCGEHWEYKLSDISPEVRLIAGEMKASDVGLPPEADQWLLDITEPFIFGMLPGSVSGLPDMWWRYRNWIRVMVDGVNKFKLRYPTKEEENLALVKQELKTYTPRKVEVHEKDGKILISVGHTFIETADTALIEEARAYQKKQEEEKLREKVEVLQDGSDEPACALVDEIEEVKPYSPDCHPMMGGGITETI